MTASLQSRRSISNVPIKLDASQTNAGEVKKVTPVARPVEKAALEVGPVKKVTPDYASTIYDSIRPVVSSILSVTDKFQIKSSRTKGAVLQCGNEEDDHEDGFGTSILPLKVASGKRLYVDNPLVLVLGMYADKDEHADQDALPELILGLCCNNWGMYHGRNALIEAFLAVMGPNHQSKLSIHAAIYALELNTDALSEIIGKQDSEALQDEASIRKLHADGFRSSAAKYGIELDLIEQNTSRRFGDHCVTRTVSKEAFVEELSLLTVQAVERALASDKACLDLVVEILKHRRHLQDNLSTKRFRRAPVQNLIQEAIEGLTKILARHVREEDLVVAPQIPGWRSYIESVGGADKAVLGLLCHSIDVMAGCVARSKEDIAPDVAERLVLTVLEKESRVLEYSFNQVYEMMPAATECQKMYIYRRLGDLRLFSTMACGVVEMGGKL